MYILLEYVFSETAQQQLHDKIVLPGVRDTVGGEVGKPLHKIKVVRFQKEVLKPLLLAILMCGFVPMSPLLYNTSSRASGWLVES